MLRDGVLTGRIIALAGADPTLVAALDALGAEAVNVGSPSLSEGDSAFGPPGAAGIRVGLDGIERRYAVAVTDDAIWVARDGHHLELRTHRATRDGAGALAGSLEAPMPGTVLLVHVADGDTVEEGQVLMVLESMKMELQITAPHAGTVAGLELAPGDRVALRQPLLAVTEETDS